MTGALAAGPARADIIKCSFTEPFVTMVYSTGLNSLTIVHDVEKRTETLGGISLQIRGPGLFELWNSDHRPVVRLKLSSEGSDGMSDRTYPYEAEWITQKLHGGCTSNHLQSK